MRLLYKRKEPAKRNFTQIMSFFKSSLLPRPQARTHILQPGIYYCVVIMYFTQEVLCIASKGVLSATTEA